MSYQKIISELKAQSNPEKAQELSSFFQTQKGQYGEGDTFLGIPVPNLRKMVASYKKLPLAEVEKLLQSKYHEVRFTAILILVNQFEQGDAAQKKIIYDFYLNHTEGINSWDLVDVSCYKIVGAWLLDKDRKPIYNLANKNNLWEQRIAIVSTMAFIRKNQFDDTLRLSECFLTHNHHLIHKACGWMLREVGKRNKPTLINFLNKYAHQMPRIMLRYSIEKLPKEKRIYYLRASVK